MTRPRFVTRLVITLAGVGLIAPGAGAKLYKYGLQQNQAVESTTSSPNPKWTINTNTPAAYAVIEESGGPPVLKKYARVNDTSITTLVPQLGGFIYTSSVTTEGPSGEFTGAGSTASTIAWGLLTGWTITGTHWCNSSPSYVCDLADRIDQESADPTLKSAFYDLGTWTFHGTGFTGTPYVFQTFSQGPGNTQYWPRGLLILDGTIPALPAVGLVALGGSLALGSLAELRRRRK